MGIAGGIPRAHARGLACAAAMVVPDRLLQAGFRPVSKPWEIAYIVGRFIDIPKPSASATA
jgi:hypothetical protein